MLAGTIAATARSELLPIQPVTCQRLQAVLKVRSQKRLEDSIPEAQRQPLYDAKLIICCINDDTARLIATTILRLFRDHFSAALRTWIKLPDDGFHEVDCYWFSYMSVEACLTAFDVGFLVALSSDRHEAQTAVRRILLTDESRDFPSIQARHPDIEKDHMWLDAVDGIDDLTRVSNENRFVPHTDE